VILPELRSPPVPFPVVGHVDLRLFTFGYARGSDGEWAAADVEFVDEQRMPVRIADVVEVNALAVPLRAPANYDVMQHELRLVLSYLPDNAGGPLSLRKTEFKASSSHIRRFVTESFGLGALTAAAKGKFGWELDSRSLEHFDVLPAKLAGRYYGIGTRPDLLFRFQRDGLPWSLAGEARGRSTARPKANAPSAAQRRRLDQIVGWSARHDFHPVTMTWAYTGSSEVQVDLFVSDEPELDDSPGRPSESSAVLPAYREDGLATGPSADPSRVPDSEILFNTDLSPQEIAARIEEVLRSSAVSLYRTAPESSVRRSILDRNVRGDWVRADLVGQSDAHLFLGILDAAVRPEELTVIRRARTGAERAQDPVQVDVMGRIMVAVAFQAASPPSWSDIEERLR
jgi:hypothetical protein